MEDFLRIFGAVASTSLFAALLGFGLAIAAKKFRVVKNPTLEKISAALPGLNCGICGYTGCEAYAEALSLEKESDTRKCRPGGQATIDEISQILGIESSAGTKRMVARLACLGGTGIAVQDFSFQAYEDCESLKLHFDGDKGCKYGCMGLGSCIKVCPVDAISKTDNGLVEVSAARCIGCELCVKVCPSGVMKMIPADTDFFVACNSRDKGKLTKALCSAGCIGCRICEKKFPESGFQVEDNLASLNYNKKDNEGRMEAAQACPAKCIIQAGSKTLLKT
ncbi:MAG: hypothetical protein B0D92_07155 [Spirochaeta sp. LUC14_002_19_P3]|nr:MAG: hypothetical protein B0D92_07155 [Spirochaeta sp. LUC14_002_19_P3]